MAVVYQHRRKDTNEIFYIGMGRDINRAYSKHSRNKYWKNIVNKYGYSVDILIEGCKLKEARTVEIGLIKEYGRSDLDKGPLVNMTDGGEGFINLSKDSILRRVLHTDYNLVSAKRSLAYDYKNQITINKRVANTDYKSRKTDYKLFQSKRVKLIQIPILQYDLQYNLIKEWDSAKIAAKELNINHQTIGRCCRKEKYYHTAYGFIWEFK